MPPFKYEPFHNPYVGSIIDLMGRGDEAKAQALIRIGEIEAQAARQRGQAWSGAIQNVGSTVSQGIQSWQDEKAQAKAQARIDEDRAKADILWSRGVDEFDEVKRAAALGGRALSGSTYQNTQVGLMPTFQTKADGSMMMEDVPTPPGMLPSQRPVIDEHPFQTTDANGQLLWSPDKLLKSWAASGIDLAKMEPFARIMESANATKKSNLEATVASARETAALVAGMPGESLLEAMSGAINFFKNSGLPQSVLESFEQLIADGDVPALRRMLVQFSGIERKFESYNQEDTVFDPLTGEIVQKARVKPGPLVKVINPGGPELPPVYGHPKEGDEAYVAPATTPAPEDYTDVKAIVRGMKAGTLPPQLPGRASKGYLMLMAETERQGFDLAEAATDWMATTAHIRAINSTKQLALRQGIETLPPMLDIVEDLAKEWAAGDYPILNSVRLAAAKGGAMGHEAAVIANDLEAMIADITADLGNVYMGGNSPTDHALKLAAKSLSAEWSEEVLLSMVNLARRNIQIRKNSIRNVGAAGVQSDYYGFKTRDMPSGPPGGMRLWNPHLESWVDVAYTDVNAALAAGLTKGEGSTTPVSSDWFDK
jgi:hypothetical protein